MSSRAFRWCPAQHAGDGKRAFHTRDRKTLRPYFCPVCKKYYTVEEIGSCNTLQTRVKK